MQALIKKSRLGFKGLIDCAFLVFFVFSSQIPCLCLIFMHVPKEASDFYYKLVVVFALFLLAVFLCCIVLYI